MTIEAVGFDDRFDRNAICPLRYPDRDLCADCYSAFCAWFNGGRRP